LERRKLGICPNPQKNVGDFLKNILAMWQFFWKLSKMFP
jgi:hypothetical protein